MTEIRPQSAARCLVVVAAVVCLAATQGLAGSVVPEPGPSQPGLRLLPELQVNSFTTGDQLQVHVDANPVSGEFVVVWASYGSPMSAGDDDGTSVQAQRYVATGEPDGDQFQVNTLSTGNQFLPSVAISSAGDFLVAWTSAAGDGDASSIRAQHYDASGVATAPEFQVNTATTGNQYYPAAAVDAAGFVVVWDSEAGNPDTNGFAIQGRLIGSSGVPSGGEFSINSHTTGDQLRPRVSVDGSGNFVAVWQSESSPGSDSSLTSVRMRRFNASGSAVGVESQVNSAMFNRQQSPTVAHDPLGGFLVTWESEESLNIAEGQASDDDGFSIQAQRYDNAGSVVGNEFQVNTYTTGGQRYPVAEFSPSGEFVVAWDSSGSSGDDSSLYSIQARQFTVDPEAQGDDFQVNDFTTTGQSLPSISRRNDQNFVVAWQSRGSFGNDSSGYSVQLVPEPGSQAASLAALSGLTLLLALRRRSVAA